MNTTIVFGEGETIWTELSEKYDLIEFEKLVTPQGVEVIKRYYDKKKYYKDSLLEKV